MRRWGQITEAKPDAWYDEIAQDGLPAGGLPEGGADAGRRGQGRRRPTSRGTPTAIARRPPNSSTASTYDGRKPNAYIDTLGIGLKGAADASTASTVGRRANDGGIRPSLCTLRPGERECPPQRLMRPTVTTLRATRGASAGHAHQSRCRLLDDARARLARAVHADRRRRQNPPSRSRSCGAAARRAAARHRGVPRRCGRGSRRG